MTEPGLDTDPYQDGIPPFSREPKNGTREATANMIHRIDAKIKKLAALGLRPHPNMVGYRADLVGQLECDGPYLLHETRMVL